jgi:hypothetical protein
MSLPANSPKSRIAASLGILVVGFLIVWALPAIFDEVQNPPGPDPTQEALIFWGGVLAMLLAVYIAAIFWFRASAFFSFGCLASIPLAIYLFYPQVDLTFRSADTAGIHRAGWTTFAFCISVGCGSAPLVRIIAFIKSRNHRVQS